MATVSNMRKLPPINMGYKSQKKVDANNLGYFPKESTKEIPRHKVKWQAKSKIGSLDPDHVARSTRRRSINSDGILSEPRIRFRKIDSNLAKRWPALRPDSSGVLIANPEAVHFHGNAKVRSLDNKNYQPGGGNKPIFEEKTRWEAAAKLNSLDNKNYVPGNSNKVIYDEKVRWNGAPKVGSLDNNDYTPRGGNVQIHQEKLAWDGTPRVGSLDNNGHRPGGGNVKIIDNKIRFDTDARAKVDSLDNVDYKPRESNIAILNETPRWQADPKVGSLTNAKYQPSGGNLKPIHDEKVQWQGAPKVGSLDNRDYKPGGGNIRLPMKILPYPIGKLEDIPTYQTGQYEVLTPFLCPFTVYLF